MWYDIPPYQKTGDIRNASKQIWPFHLDTGLSRSRISPKSNGLKPHCPLLFWELHLFRKRYHQNGSERLFCLVAVRMRQLMKIPLEFGGTWFESLAPRAPFDAEIVGLLFGSAAVFISYEKSAFLGLPGVSVTLSHGWMVGLYFMFSLLLSMIFTKKFASSPLVMWFELSMFVRYGWAFGTRVLKTRIPELVLSESFFPMI